MYLKEIDIQVTDKGVAMLTPRERQVLLLLARGAENKHIVRVLGISLGTVMAYVQSVYEKLEVGHRDMNPRPAAVTVAICKGLLLIGDKCGCHASV